MGSQLVGRAIEHALPTLAGRGPASTILLVMAHHAVDRSARPYFSKGDDYLAQRLGHLPGDRSGHTKVERARKYLIEAGFVAPDDSKRPARFKRRWYLLLPDG